jgi:hypothetical protein
MYLFGYYSSRKLVKIGKHVINVHDGAVVKYKANYYKEGLVTHFIGIVATSKVTDGEITGIYITPLYIFHGNEWCKIRHYNIPPYRSSFLYPHLLMLSSYCSIYAAHTALDYLDTVENVSIADFTISDRVIPIV